MLNKNKGRKKTDNFSKDAETQTGSKDSDYLKILASSAALKWEGVSIERGHTNLLVVDDFTIPKHWFGMIVSNALTWEYKDGSTMKTLTTYPGQICIYPAHIPSSRRMEGYYEFISLTLEPDRLWHGINGISSRTHHEFLCRHNVDDPQLRALMHTLMAEAEARNPNGRLFVESLTLALSIHFVKHYSAEMKVIPEYRTGLTRRQLQHTFEYVEANLTEEISLDTLAKEVSLSKYYFSRLFKRSTGLTPYQYVLQRRLERAKAFLKHGESSIVEIAHLFGFSDQSHFSRLFRKRYGITPGNFLKNNHGLMTS